MYVLTYIAYPSQTSYYYFYLRVQGSWIGLLRYKSYERFGGTHEGRGIQGGKGEQGPSSSGRT